MSKIKFFVIFMALVLSFLLIPSCNNTDDPTAGGDQNNGQPPQINPDDTQGDGSEECIHKYGDWEIILDSTCIQKGKKTRVCSICKQFETVDIELKDHTVVTVLGIEPTCETDGWTEGKICLVCKKVLVTQEVIKARGHIYIDGICSCGAKDENYNPSQPGASSSGLSYVISEDKSYYIVNGMTDNTNLHVLIPSTYNDLPVKEIAGYAFMDCQFESIEFENGIERIGEWAFLRCQSLRKVTFPQSLKSIDNAAFNVTDVCEVHISDLSAWCNVSSSAGINLFDEGTYLYVNGTKLTDLVMPDDVMTTRGAFAGIQTLKSLIIPGRFKTVPDRTFFGCSGLTEITIENGVTKIGDQTFENCSSLKSLVLPNSITHISFNAFQYCEMLTNVYYSGTSEQWESIFIEDGNENLLDATIHYLGESEVTEPSFVVSNSTVNAGDSVEITVSLENNPGIASIVLSVAFDSDALTLTEVIYNDSIGGQTVQPQNMKNPVKLYWINGFADAEGDFVLATLRFTVNTNATAGDYNIALSYNADDVYDISETNLPFEIVNGKITVKQ